jgi:hypothetical protein
LLSVVAAGLRVVLLSRDDSRRIVMPVVLVQVLVFDCGVASIFVSGFQPFGS